MSFLGGLINTEQMTIDTIQASLEAVADELGCSHTELFFMIKPINEKFDFKVWIYRNQKIVKEITVKEILNE